MILDDATSEIYYAQLVEEESTLTVMAGLKEVIERKGVFCALYSDRGSHFWRTPKLGGKVDGHRLTQVGRAMRESGGADDSGLFAAGAGPQRAQLRHLARTAAAGVAAARDPTLDAANGVLREHYIAEFNRRFQVRAEQPGNAFVARRSRDLDLIFALQFERTVNRDNTVSIQNLRLQIEAVRWRASLAGCSVTVHQHLDGTFSLTHGPHRLGGYDAHGVALAENKTAARRAVEKPRGGKVPKPTFPPRLEIPQKTRDSHFPTAPTAAGRLTQTGHVTC